jgi:hypothetical protein
MEKYLLLRDNKQTGPLSLDEIREMGLKKYDLIWVEGKSAAWRYAGELQEMKSFAPEVEEQPFDRFYRKPVHEEHYQLKQREETEKEIIPSKKLDESRKTFVDYSSGKQVGKRWEEKKIPPRKYVSISLPRSPYPNFEPLKKSFPEKTEQQPEVPQTPASKPKLEPIFPANDVSAVVENKLASISTAQEFPDINEPITGQNSLSQKVMQYIALTLGVLSFVVIGVLVFDTMTTKPVTIPVYKSSVQRPTPKVVPEVQNIQTIPTVNTLTTSEESVSSTSPTTKKTQPEAPAEKIIETPVNEAPSSSSSSIISPVPEPEKPAVTPPSLENQVVASMNDYRVSYFGGIDDLKIKLTNNSTYRLDLVVVELQYVLTNKKIYKTETIRFRDIEPGQNTTLDGPNSPRGMKVNSRVTYITSSQAGISENF